MLRTSPVTAMRAFWLRTVCGLLLAAVPAEVAAQTNTAVF